MSPIEEDINIGVNAEDAQEGFKEAFESLESFLRRMNNAYKRFYKEQEKSRKSSGADPGSPFSGGHGPTGKVKSRVRSKKNENKEIDTQVGKLGKLRRAWERIAFQLGFVRFSINAVQFAMQTFNQILSIEPLTKYNQAANKFVFTLMNIADLTKKEAENVVGIFKDVFGRRELLEPFFRDPDAILFAGGLHAFTDEAGKKVEGLLDRVLKIAEDARLKFGEDPVMVFKAVSKLILDEPGALDYAKEFKKLFLGGHENTISEAIADSMGNVDEILGIIEGEFARIDIKPSIRINEFQKDLQSYGVDAAAWFVDSFAPAVASALSEVVTKGDFGGFKRLLGVGNEAGDPTISQALTKGGAALAGIFVTSFGGLLTTLLPTALAAAFIVDPKKLAAMGAAITNGIFGAQKLEHNLLGQFTGKFKRVGGLIGPLRTASTQIGDALRSSIDKVAGLGKAGSELSRRLLGYATEKGGGFLGRIFNAGPRIGLAVRMALGAITGLGLSGYSLAGKFLGSITEGSLGFLARIAGSSRVLGAALRGALGLVTGLAAAGWNMAGSMLGVGAGAIAGTGMKGAISKLGPGLAARLAVIMATGSAVGIAAGSTLGAVAATAIVVGPWVILGAAIGAAIFLGIKQQWSGYDIMDMIFPGSGQSLKDIDAFGKNLLLKGFSGVGGANNKGGAPSTGGGSGNAYATPGTVPNPFESQSSDRIYSNVVGGYVSTTDFKRLNEWQLSTDAGVQVEYPQDVKVHDFDRGGRVPGTQGQPKLAVVHGGEIVRSVAGVGMGGGGNGGGGGAGVAMIPS